MSRNHIIAVALLGWISACTSEPASGPPQVREGRDECAGCGMIISEGRCTAALLVEESGSRSHLIFDDLGCMLDHEREQGVASRVIERYVRDYATGQWVACERATFVRCPRDRVQTPMGSGLIAFADRHAADEFASRVAGSLETLAEVSAARARQFPRAGG